MGCPLWRGSVARLSGSNGRKAAASRGKFPIHTPTYDPVLGPPPPQTASPVLTLWATVVAERL
jgi:hypothetical protein